MCRQSCSISRTTSMSRLSVGTKDEEAVAAADGGGGLWVLWLRLLRKEEEAEAEEEGVFMMLAGRGAGNAAAASSSRRPGPLSSPSLPVVGVSVVWVCCAFWHASCFSLAKTARRGWLLRALWTALLLGNARQESRPSCPTHTAHRHHVHISTQGMSSLKLRLCGIEQVQAQAFDLLPLSFLPLLLPRELCPPTPSHRINQVQKPHAPYPFYTHTALFPFFSPLSSCLLLRV